MHERPALRPARTDPSGWAVPQLVRALDSFECPGTLLLLGDVLEMWFVQPPDGSGSLAAHEDLVAAVDRFRSRPARTVVYVIGNHDARLAWDGRLLEKIRDRLRCVFAFSAELIPDGSGRRVRIEHGHAHDPSSLAAATPGWWRATRATANCPRCQAFYANTGSCTRVIDRVRARFRLPAVYLPRLQLSWIVLECEDDWSVRLFVARRTSEGASRLDRLATAPDARRLATDPVEVARWPDGPLLPE